MKRADLLVIGGGAAGAAAALAARAHGLTVTLVRRAPGATAMAGGGWAGPMPDVVADALLAQRLTHVDVPHPLPHPDGELRTYDYAAAGAAAARVETGACVVGIEGLPAFRPVALGRLWGAAAQAELGADAVRLPGTPAAGWAPAALADAIQHDPGPLAAALRDVAARTRCTRLILPAVLGMDDPASVRARLESAAGVPVGEALGTAPALPGWRLQRALERALRAAGVDLVDGTVADVARAGARCTAVNLVVAATGAAAPYAAERFLLATGRYVGGGIVADPAFAEPAFGAAVRVEHLGERFEEVDPLVLSDPVRVEPQPLLRAGVHVDALHRLLHDGANGALTNVWAAGTVRSGAACGLGGAAADGVAAVERMLQQ